MSTRQVTPLRMIAALCIVALPALLLLGIAGGTHLDGSEKRAIALTVRDRDGAPLANARIRIGYPGSPAAGPVDRLSSQGALETILECPTWYNESLFGLLVDENISLGHHVWIEDPATSEEHLFVLDKNPSYQENPIIIRLQLSPQSARMARAIR